jgi:site-specific DNA-methyltransferase (adenine-specific)
MFVKLAGYANEKGDPAGRPYFSRDGIRPMTLEEWTAMRPPFHCPMGVTNVWDRGPLSGSERVRLPQVSGKAVHLNQKPLDLMQMIIEASSVPGGTVWEPFGGLFSASLAAVQLGRKAFAGEIDPTYFQLGLRRFQDQRSLF